MAIIGGTGTGRKDLPTIECRRTIGNPINASDPSGYAPSDVDVQIDRLSRGVLDYRNGLLAQLFGEEFARCLLSPCVQPSEKYPFAEVRIAMAAAPSNEGGRTNFYSRRPVGYIASASLTDAVLSGRSAEILPYSVPGDLIFAPSNLSRPYRYQNLPFLEGRGFIDLWGRIEPLHQFLNYMDGVGASGRIGVYNILEVGALEKNAIVRTFGTRPYRMSYFVDSGRYPPGVSNGAGRHVLVPVEAMVPRQLLGYHDWNGPDLGPFVPIPRQ